MKSGVAPSRFGHLRGFLLRGFLLGTFVFGGLLCLFCRASRYNNTGRWLAVNGKAVIDTVDISRKNCGSRFSARPIPNQISALSVHVGKVPALVYSHQPVELPRIGRRARKFLFDELDHVGAPGW